MSIQFGRKCGLLVYSPTGGSAAPGTALDLSNMRIHFRIEQSDYETPNNAVIRVYNLKPATQRLIQGEFQRINLQAGYDFPGGYGVIFDGSIKQVLFGHETNTDSYTDIIAADGDEAYNNAFCNNALAAGAKSADQLSSILKSTSAFGVTQGYTLDLPQTALSRGKVQFGLVRTQLRNLSRTLNASWSIQNGQLKMIPITDYTPGTAIVLSSETGLVGFPEQTPGGITADCLINPKIQIGAAVQIAAEDINQSPVVTSGPLLYGTEQAIQQYANAGNIARISGSGFYKVLVMEYEGDTRGEPWYQHLTCLGIDNSAPVGSRVNAYYGGGNLGPGVD